MTIVNEKLANYILTSIDTEGYDVNAKTVKEKLQFLADTFKSEYHLHTQTGFSSWIGGLPSSFNIEYRTHAILELAYLFDMIQATDNEDAECYILNNLFNMIGEETFNLFNDHKINL